MTCRRLLLAALLALSACTEPLEASFAHSTDAPSRTGLLPVEGGVVVGNEAGALVRLDAAGRPVWRVMLQREVAALPAVAEGTVVAGTVAGEWVGVALADGAVRWRQVDAPPLTVPLASLGPRVFAVSPEGAVRGIHAATGGTAWALLPPPALRRAPPSSPLPAPVACAGTLAVALGSAGLVGLSPEEGERRWRHPFPDVTGLACAGGRVLVGRAGGELVAVDGASGEVVWTRPLGPLLVGPPVVGDGRVWGRTGPRTLVGVSPAGDGPPLQVTSPVDLGAPPAVAPGLLVLTAEGREGRVVGLGLPEGRKLFEARVDSRLPTPPLLWEERLWLLALDGRVLGYRVRRPGGGAP